MSVEDFQNKVTFTVKHVLTEAMLQQCMLISAGQQEQMHDSIAPMHSWDDALARNEIMLHLEEYGARLAPAWLADKYVAHWLSTAGETARRMKHLIGNEFVVEANLNHFGAVCLFEAWLDEAMGLRPSGYLLEALAESHGSRFVSIPGGEFALADEPGDRIGFERRLRRLTDGLTREKLDNIIRTMVARGGPYWSGRVMHTRPHRVIAERIVQEHYSEIARCTASGFFYTQRIDGHIGFCANVCDKHRRGREHIIGERPLFEDGSDSEPRRCEFSRNIPFLER